jgi:hypothetical protein
MVYQRKKQADPYQRIGLESFVKDKSCSVLIINTKIYIHASHAIPSLSLTAYLFF